MTQITRRNFLVGCSAGIAAMAGSKMHSLSYASPAESGATELLVTIFLRGGCDVLNLIPPIGGADRGYYEAARANLQVPVSQALALGSDPFGLHPAASALHNLYGDGKLAIVQATGMDTTIRSHFVAMAYMEGGTPGDATTTTGWITRHLESSPHLASDAIVPVLAAGGGTALSTQGYGNVLALSDTSSFNLNTGFTRWREKQLEAMQLLYDDSSQIRAAGKHTLAQSTEVNRLVSGEYTPEQGAIYTDNNNFHDQLKLIAQMVKSGTGLKTATIDLGGWDTHDYQGDGSDGYFSGLVGTLSNGLTAFYNDLNTSGADNYIGRTTIVVMSEFGRRLRENAGHGTDHGHGGAMMVLGGKVNGGLYGNWPGLETSQLFDRGDLAVTTDYRQVLSELLIRRLGNPNLGQIFPNYRNYQPLGLVQGEDLTPKYELELNNKVFLPVLMD